VHVCKYENKEYDFKKRPHYHVDGVNLHKEAYNQHQRDDRMHTPDYHMKYIHGLKVADIMAI
jgi:hypothetical protein